MTINKIFIVILSVLIYLYVTVWTFNHVDAWVAIGIFILGIYIASKQIFKNNKKEEK